MSQAPAGATEWSSRDFRSPGRGSDSIFTTNRWFAPPANVQCPFGTSRSLSSSNSRYAIRSRWFEVEDCAKQIPARASHSNAQDGNSRFFQRENLPSKYIWPRNVHRFVLEGTTPTMKKLIILAPLLAVAAMLLASCTTVVEKPAPATTTTTTHTESVKRMPSTSVEQQTTTRSSGNY